MKAEAASVRWSFLPERVRLVAEEAATASRRAQARPGDPTDYAPFAGAWELSAGLVSLARTLPLSHARQLVLVLWHELARLEYDRREMASAMARERAELLSRLDGLNRHIDALTKAEADAVARRGSESKSGAWGGWDR